MVSAFAQRFNNAKEQFPERNALCINGRFFTYAELNEHVEKIRFLLEVELKSCGQVIAVADEQTVWNYAAIIAISLSQNTLLPFNPKAPKARTAYMFEKVAPALVLSFDDSPDVHSIIVESGIHTSWFVFSTNGFKFKNEMPGADAVFSNVAYIIFTSGSTGRPKAVPISYSNLDHCLGFFFDEYDFDDSDRFLQVYDTSFDVFYFSFLVPLSLGACCFILNKTGKSIVYLEIFKALKEYAITVVSMVPTTLLFVERYLHEQEFPALRYSFFSGDILYQTIAVQWKKCLPNGVIHNFYGPTETTIVCTRYLWEEQRALGESFNNIVPIGVPFPGMNYLILNEEGLSVHNEIGELAFSGSQVFDGYIGNEGQDRFMVDEETETVFYKTGDMVYVNERRQLVFTGRKDFQFKINGFRVELAEIETAVSKITGAPNVVVVKKNQSNLNDLVCFILKCNLTEKEIINALRGMLPEYMIPKKIITTGEFPLNANNKIDRLALRQSIE